MYLIFVQEHVGMWVLEGYTIMHTTCGSIHLVPRLRMRGTIPPLPNTSSWRGI